MELSPKQQAVEQIKKANKVLVLGHKKPSGDMVGSGLAICNLLTQLGKKVDFVVTEAVPAKYNFLELGKIQTKFDFLEGKLLRIKTEKFPVKGLRYQKNEEFLDIFLDADKNLKFEYLEIKNGTERPDLIVALDTPKLEELDGTLKEYPDVFVGVPILNIDHHAGNDFFGAVNLVDLTATSTAEILVSLFEALGHKISDATVATGLLLGIIEDTESFQKSNTTPKSFTVAAQLLAAGAKQQEIIAGLYKKESDKLMALWKNLTQKAKDDKKFALTWVGLAREETSGSTLAEITEASFELLKSLKETDKLLVVVEIESGKFQGLLFGEGTKDVAATLKAKNQDGALLFDIHADNINNAELKMLKILADHWSKDGAPSGLWEVLVKEGEQEALSKPETLAEVQSVMAEPEILTPPETEQELEATGAKNLAEDTGKKKTNFDPIENAIKSLADNQQQTKGFATLKEIMEKKQRELGNPKKGYADDIDVFDEEE